MKYLRDIFDGEVVAEVNEEGYVVIGETPFSPADLLRLDATAYEAGYKAWLANDWLVRQEYKLDEILAHGSNANRFRELCAAVSQNYVVPLVGSGMSQPSGLPLWSEFLREVCKSSTMPQKDFNRLLIRSEFEKAAESLISRMPGDLFDEKVNHKLQVYEDSHIDGPVRFLPSLFPKLVLTTNLDNVLERVYAEQNQSFGGMLHGEEIAHYRRDRASTASLLLKLHGDYRRREGRVLTKKEYDNAYAEGEGVVARELALIYQTSSLLCLGSSLGPDRTVELIGKVAKVDGSVPKHFAFLRLPETEEEQVDREHFLVDRRIFPIWHGEDHNACITALLVGLMTRTGPAFSEVA